MKPVRIPPRANTEINALADFIACDSLDAAMRFLDAVRRQRPVATLLHSSGAYAACDR